MQKWAKRGIQTAMVSGGLLMLGTGIASAAENVSPDVTPNNLLSGVLGQVDKATAPVQQAVSNVTGKAKVVSTSKKQDAAKPKTVTTNKNAININVGTGLKLGANKLNKTDLPNIDTGHISINPDLSILNPLVNAVAPGFIFDYNKNLPVFIHHNAIALLNDSTTSGDDNFNYENVSNTYTDAKGKALGGNVIVDSWQDPVVIDGNAIGIGGKAKTSGSTTGTSITGGDNWTNGDGAPLAGNMYRNDTSTPWSFTGIALSALGQASSDQNTNITAHAIGTAKSSGKNAQGSGNVLEFPWSAPLLVYRVPVTLLGKSTSTGSTVVDSSGGMNHPTIDPTGDKPYNLDTPSVTTSGKGGAVSGNVAHIPLATAMGVHDLAGGFGGNALADGTSSVTNGGGGGLQTDGTDGKISGNYIAPQLATVIAVFSDAVSSLGQAKTNATESVINYSGGHDHTYGDRGLLSGSAVDSPVAPVIEAYSAAANLVGKSDATASKNTTDMTGGYAGTTGSDSTASGTLVGTPVSFVGEVFGLAGGAGGNSTATGDETKNVRAGGPVNSNDDHGTISSNVIYTPLNTVLQAMGHAATVAGTSTASGSTNTTTVTGRSANASGKDGIVSANVVQGALGLAEQLTGSGTAIGGKATGTALSSIDQKSGGKATSTGENGVLSGIVANAAAGQPTTVGGLTASGLGKAFGTSDNTVAQAIGGPASTTGKNGIASGVIGNLPVTGQAAFDAIAASAGGNSKSSASNAVTSVVGGPATTSGENGKLLGGAIADLPVNGSIPAVSGAVSALSGTVKAVDTESTNQKTGGPVNTNATGAGFLGGQILSAPVAPIAQAIAPAAAVGGLADAHGDSDLTAVSGGKATSVNGSALQVPVGAAVQIMRLALGATPLSSGNSNVDVTNGTNKVNPSAVDLGGLMGATSSPTVVMARKQALPKAQDGVLPTIPNLPVVSTLGLTLPVVGNVGGAQKQDAGLPVSVPSLGFLGGLLSILGIFR